MNKAFVRESDAPPPACPGPRGCGSVGTDVPRTTLRALLPAAEADAFASDVFYCANPVCEVAYYDAWGRTVPVTALPIVTWPKNPRGPVCACLGVAADTIIEEARAGRKDTLLRILGYVRGGDSRCVENAPDGRTCEQAARRLFLQNRTG